MVQVVRYSNRKYYSREFGGFIGLRALAAVVRAGTDLRITCIKTKRDITSEVLMRALLEIEMRHLPNAELVIRALRSEAGTLSGLVPV